MIAYAPATGTFRTPGGRAVTMHYRHDTNDWNTLTASLDEDEYGLPSGMRGVAIDVGGYLGSVGIALALDNPKMRVVIIEPVPDNYELIIRNAQQNGVLGQVSVIQGAVGKGTVEVGHSYRGSEAVEHHAFVGNSTLASDEPHETESYRAITLQQLLLEYERIDFLKIDCEGGEWDFLSVPETSELPLIVGEAHATGGHQGVDIVALLPRHDVILTGDYRGTCGFRAVRRA